MFFTELLQILNTCQSISIVMEKKDDKVVLSVLPKYSDDKAKLPPLVMSGTAEELDNGFVKAFGKVNAEIGIFSNIDQFLQQAKEAEKDAKGKSKVADKKESTDTKGSTEKPAANDSKTKTRTKENAQQSSGTPQVDLPGDLFNKTDVESTTKTESKPAVQETVQTTPPAVKEEPAPVQAPVQAVQQPSVQPTTTTAAKVTGDDDIF